MQYIEIREVGSIIIPHRQHLPIVLLQATEALVMVVEYSMPFHRQCSTIVLLPATTAILMAEQCIIFLLQDHQLRS